VKAASRYKRYQIDGKRHPLDTWGRYETPVTAKLANGDLIILAEMFMLQLQAASRNVAQ